MPFIKGKSGNPGGRKRAMLSPITLSFCKSHYEQAIKLIDKPQNWANVKDYFDSLMNLLKFEHAELFGKPREKITAEINGGVTFTVRIEGKEPLTIESQPLTQSLPLDSGLDS